MEAIHNIEGLKLQDSFEVEDEVGTSELYIHGRLTPAQKVKPSMAEFEGVLVRHSQSSTCTAVRQYI